MTAAPETTTTGAPASTTTAAAGSPAFSSVTVEVDPDDGADHHSNSVQVSTAATLKLVWETTNATKTNIDPLGDMDASGSVDIKSEDATFTLIAFDDSGAQSPPYFLEIHTNSPEEVVSQHVDVLSGVSTTTTATPPTTTTEAPPTTTTAAPGTTTKAPGSTTTAPARAISALKVTYAGKDGEVELTSRPGSFNDASNDQEKKHTQQHFPAGGGQLTFSWTAAGFENAVIDVHIDQLSALPKGETKSSKDFFTGLTKDGSGTVDYDFQLPSGRVTLWIDVSIFDPKDLTKPVDTRCVIAFTDSGLPAIDKISIEAGTAGQLFCNWSVLRAPASNVWLSIADESGKPIGDPVQLRDVKANAATSGRTLLPDTSKFAGQKLSFTAAIFMVADGSGKANAAPFDIASEGLVIGTPTTVTFATAPPTTAAPAHTTTSPPLAGAASHVVTVRLGNKTTLKPLVVADGKLKTSKVSFTFELKHSVEDPSAGVPANPPPDPTSVEIAVLDPSGATIKTETFTSGEQLQLGTHTWEWDGYSDANLLDTQLLRRDGLSVQVTVKAPGVADSIGTLRLGNSADGLLFTDVKIDSGANTVGVTVRFSAMAKPIPVIGKQSTESEVEAVRAAVEAGIANYWSRKITIDSAEFTVTSKTATAVDDAISVIVIPEVPPARSCNIGMFLPSFTGDGVLFMVEPGGNTARDQETGAHEIGHAIVAIRQGKAFSAQHKGTSTIAGDLTSAAVPHPALGEIDLMRYYSDHTPADFATRERLIETDMKDLLEFTAVVFSASP
jgi:hypothetical protein